MDSMIIQLDTAELSGPWRHIMHDNDAGSGIAASRAAAEAAARLSQTILAQGLSGLGPQMISPFSLKSKSPGMDVERPHTSHSGITAPSFGGSGSSSHRSSPLFETPRTSSLSSPSTSSAIEDVTPSRLKGAPANPPAKFTFPRTLPNPGDLSIPAADETNSLYTFSPASFFSGATTGTGTPSPRKSLKRARPPSDVDGPLTSTLACKKRRLLRHMVTSRLSRRFSVPATHIPNLESTIGLSGGGGMEKRFLKLAAMAAARRLQSSAPGFGPSAQLQLRQQHQHTPPASEQLRRAAIINRFRQRVSSEATQRGDTGVAEMAASTALLHFSPSVPIPTTASGLAGFPALPPSDSRHSAALMPPPPRRPNNPPSSPTLPPTTRTALFVVSRSETPQSPSLNHMSTPPGSRFFPPSQPAQAPQRPSVPRPPPTPFALPASITAARPLARAAAIIRHSASPGVTPPGSPSKCLRPADATGVLGSPSTFVMAASRLPSVSPRLIPLSSDGGDDDDDDGVAFPTSEHESRYESGDESDDVYTDFSVIFGGGDADADDDGMSGSDVDGYEDFMDDLDGIPWSAR